MRWLVLLLLLTVPSTAPALSRSEERGPRRGSNIREALSRSEERGPYRSAVERSPAFDSRDLTGRCRPRDTAPAIAYSGLRGSTPKRPDGADPARVRRELRQILASREYSASTRKNALERWTEGVGKAIVRTLRNLGAWIVRHLTIKESSGGGIAAVVGMWLVALGFLVAVCVVVRRIVRSSRARSSEDADDAAASYEMPTAKRLIKQAAKLADAGDYKGAFKSAYVASIAYLDETRALRFERSRTNWEYMRELKSGGHERLHGELQPLTRDFDRKIYGRESCAEQDYINAAAVYERLSSEEAR